MWNPLAALPPSNGALAAYGNGFQRDQNMPRLDLASPAQQNQNLPPMPLDQQNLLNPASLEQMQQLQMQQAALHPIYQRGPEIAMQPGITQTNLGALASGFAPISTAWNPNLRDRQSYLPGF